MNPDGPDAFWHSKKFGTMVLVIALNMLMAYLKIRYPTYNDVWLQIGGLNTLIGGSYILGESHIDAAAVKRNTPDTVVQQNVQTEPPADAPSVIHADRPTYSG